MAGGVITLTNGASTSTGSFLHSGTPADPGLLQVNGAGASFTATGTVTLGGGSLAANSGGSITMTGATSVSGLTSASPSFTATGAGSVVDVNNVTNWSGSTNGQTFTVRSLTAGLVDLDSVATISTGSTRFEANGAGSVIDLTALTSFSRTVPGNATSYLLADGGTIQTPNLTTVSNVDLAVSGAGTIDTADINSVRGSSITADGGADITFPLLTAYTASSVFSPTSRATGAGSTVDLNNVTNWSGGTNGQTVNAQAFAGGLFDLDSVATISTGSTRFEANGAGSVIDLTALTSFSRTVTGNASSYLLADGGTIQTPSLTTLTNVNLQINGAGTIDTADITSATGAGLYAREAGQLIVPALVTYTGPNQHSTDFNPSGAGTLVSLPALTTLNGAAGGQSLTVLAQAGGTVTMNALTSIPNGRVLLRAEGANSVVNSTALATFNSTSANSLIEATTGGTINLKTTATTSVTNVETRLNSAGTINVGTLAMLGGSTLTGTGTLSGNLTNTAGQLRPNGAATGVQTIQGNLIQGANGSYELHVAGATPGTQFDQVNVTGSATLAGTVSVLRSGAFTPAFGTTYRILTAASISQYFTGLTNYNNTGTAHWLFATFYSATAVDLKVVLEGDANGDGIVSGADYTIFADHYNAISAGYANGDFNSDGVVSGADYTIWADNYNAMAPPPSMPVPEPAGWALAAVALVSAVSARRWRNRGKQVGN